MLLSRKIKFRDTFNRKYGISLFTTDRYSEIYASVYSRHQYHQPISAEQAWCSRHTAILPDICNLPGMI